MLSNQQFERTRRLALSLAGIELSERHRDLLHQRSRRSGIQDEDGIDLLLGAAEQGQPDAEERFVRLLTTKFTGFFRHPLHFDIAADHALRAVRERGEARLWSAAAATGQEPYSLAMAMIEGFDSDRPPVSILATDLDECALACAEQGEYGARTLAPIAPDRRSRHFVRKDGEDRWSVNPAVRRLVEFRSLNLVDEVWDVEGPFDVIFCRNVLMYLESSRRWAVLRRMASLLEPGGLLLLDPTEHVGPASSLFESGAAGMFTHREKQQSPAAPSADRETARNRVAV